jgi:protein subunit release factor A
MVGSGDSEDQDLQLPQDRVTDHRINVDLHNLPNVLDGDLDGCSTSDPTDQAGRRTRTGRAGGVA